MKRILQTGVFWVVMFFIVIGGVTGTDCVRAEERSFPEDFFDANWYYFKHHNENAEIAAMKENTEGLKNHYYTKGIALGYSPSVAFDPKEYIQLNDDLAKAFGNYTDAYNHFLQHVLYGNEKHRPTSNFYQSEYYAKAMNMTEWTNYQLYWHFCRFGIYEGRAGANTKQGQALAWMFNWGSYFQYNDDVKKAHEGDEDNGGRAAFGHFLLNAILGNEGRRSADFFQISYYAGQIGKSYEEAFWYYVNTGYHGISDDTVPGYYITYHAEGASGVPGRQRKADNINIVLSSAEPRRTGYTFQGWSTHENDSIIEYRPGQEYAGDAELHLYAVWKKNTYTIWYDVNGGDSSIRIPDQDKTHGEDLKLSSVEPVRVNYGFAGWATSRDAQTALYQPGAIYRQDQDATLYAVWKKDVYKVIYSANTDGADDSVTGLPESFEREAGEEIQISSAVPSREGYTFQGWGRIMEGGFVKEYKAGERFNENSTLILYASWKINTYPVTYYNADENGDYIPWRTQTKTYGEDLQLAESVPLKTGCDFKGWAVYASSSSVKYHAGDSYSENKKLDLYAVWEPKKYTVSYDANGGANAPASQTKKYGEALKLSSSSLYRQGYTFLGWSTRASDTVPEYQAGQEYSKEADLKLYAVWERLTYTIRYDANGGAFSDAPLPEEKEWGTDLVLTGKVPVRDGYEFLGWSESKSAATASYQPGGVFAKDRDTVLYAVWKEKQAQGSDNGNGGSSNGGNSNGGNSTGSNPQPDSMGQGNEGTDKTALSIQTGKSVYKVALGTKPFSLNAKEEHGSALSFQSSNPKVAKVSKDGKVTIKGCGVATITITAGTGSQAVKKTVQVQVTPKKQKIKARYNKGQRKLQVEWNKDSKASGYVVCISKSKKFAKKDTREYPYGKSVCGRIYSGLKKGTYYIRVRSYVKVGKKKYYGGWSSVKKVKVS